MRSKTRPSGLWAFHRRFRGPGPSAPDFADVTHASIGEVKLTIIRRTMRWRFVRLLRRCESCQRECTCGCQWIQHMSRRGITEWLPGWVRNKWRNSNKTPVANKTLWQKLLEMVRRHRKIEWSWVKARSGILLNE
jgi:hypothetical protein